MNGGTAPGTAILAKRVPGRRRRAYAVAWSAAPPAAVFELLADVTTWTRWAGFDEASYEREGWQRHGTGAVRRLRAGPLTSRETVLGFEPGRGLAYNYTGSLPFAQYRADVRLSPQRGGTRIEWRAEFSARHPSIGPVLAWLVRRILARLVRRLAAAAGTP